MAVPLVLLGLSGAVLTVRWSLDRTLNPALYEVRDATKAVDWDYLLRRARDEAGEESINLLRNGPAGSNVVIAQTEHERMIHLDPGTGNLIGDRSFGDPRSFVWWIQEFHTSFFLGRWGPTVVSTITAVSVLGLLTGFVLWLLPLAKAWRARLSIRDFSDLWILNWDLHNVVGFYTFPLVVLLFLTGIAIGFWPTLKPYVYEWTGSEPTGFQAKSVDPAEGDFSLDRAVRRARETWSEYELRRVAVPSAGDRPVRLRFSTPNDPYEPGLSWIWVDPYTGEILKKHHPPNRSLGDSIYLWLFPLHFGGWGHLWGEAAQALTRLVWALGALVPAGLSVTGFVIWWWK